MKHPSLSFIFERYISIKTIHLVLVDFQFIVLATYYKFVEVELIVLIRLFLPPLLLMPTTIYEDQIPTALEEIVLSGFDPV